jgi:hypothetical protein
MAGLAFAIVACTTNWPVDLFEAPEANLAGRTTYAWKGGEFGLPNETDPALLARADRALRDAIDKELAHKGYTPAATPAAADMLVSYQVAGTRRYVISDEKRIGAPSATEVLTPGGSPELPPTSVVPREQTVREGSVLVFVDDPKSGRLIWRGRIDAEGRVTSIEAGIRQSADMARAITSHIPAHH